MSRVATCFFVAGLLFGADDSWKKVQDLKSHSELRIYKKRTREPLNAMLDEANEDRIVVVVKNKQVAIPKDEIDRIDARPGKTARKVSVDSTTKESDPDLTPHPNPSIPVPGSSSSSTVSYGGDSRPGFETVYRRAEGSPNK